jgi:hypothetical protein
VIVQRIVSSVIAVAAMAAAAGVVVVAAAFAVFTVLQTYVGPSGAAAIIAAVLAVVLAAAAVLVLGSAKGVMGERRVAVPPADQGVPQRVVDLLRERPIMAAGAAVAAGLIAWRNPRLVGSVMSLFTLGRERA